MIRTMNTQYYFLHFELLVVLIVISAVASALFAIAYLGDTEKDKRTGDVRHNPKWATGFVAFLLLFLSGLSWAIAASNEPWRQEYTSTHEIKDVVFPDGSKVQMFTCDNVHHNITSMFGKVIDEKEWEIQRVRWSPLYLGVSFASCTDRCSQGDHYFLQHKKGVFLPIEVKNDSTSGAEISNKTNIDALFTSDVDKLFAPDVDK